MLEFSEYLTFVLDFSLIRFTEFSADISNLRELETGFAK